MQSLSFCTTVNGQGKSSHVVNGDQEELLSSLMDKLKTTSEQITTWSHTSRKLRMAMAKCEVPDSVDANRLRQCLKQLKMAIKGSMCLPAMVERLKSHAKLAGLKFHTNQNAREVFISSDVFYVEIMLENSGIIEDVKIFRQDDPVSCPEMRDALRQSNFKEFLEHLKGLNSFYQLHCEESLKRDAFKCLQTLEDDLKAVFQMSCLTTTNVLVLILRGLVGFVTPRIGGFPMRLTFFVSPYDLLNVEKKTSTVLNMSDPLPQDMGMSLSILLESSQNRKLQSCRILNVNAPTDGKKGPFYNFLPLNSSNSLNLPACFVLKLNKPMPLSTILIRRLAINQIKGIELTAAAPLNSLICRHAQDPTTARQSGHNTFYVNLPGEQHCYFINESNKDMKGVMVSTIPLTCTSQAIAIVAALRHQAVYNTLIVSCVRSDTHKDESEVSLFEVTTISQYKLTITFEHPAKIGMACVEMDISEVSNVKCVIHTPPGEEPLCSNEYATKVLHKCLSIPVTMRAIMKVAKSKLEKYWKPSSSSAVPAMFPPATGNTMPQNQGKAMNGGIPPKTGSTLSYIASGRMVGGPSVKTMSNSILLDLSNSVATFFAPLNADCQVQETLKTIDDSKVSQNPMLAELLTSAALSGSITNTKPTDNPVLMSLIKEHQVPQLTSLGNKSNLKRKTKSTLDNKSPRQFSDNDYSISDDGPFSPLETLLSTRHKMSSSNVSSRNSSVSDVSSIMPLSAGLESPKFPSINDPSCFVSNLSDPNYHRETTKRQKLSESVSSQSSANWPALSPQTPTPWVAGRGSGTRSTLDTPENEMIMKGDIATTPVEKTAPMNLPQHIKTPELPVNVFSTENFLSVGNNDNDDFPDFDPDDINLLDEAEVFGGSKMNRDITSVLHKSPLSSSLPLISSGKPSLIDRCQSEDIMTVTSMLDFSLSDDINEKIPVFQETTHVKQPIKSKGKPKNFKPDLEEGSMSPDPSPPPPKKAKRKTKKKKVPTATLR